MFKMNKVVSIIVLVCFLFNTAVLDLAFGQTLNYRASTDKLAPPLAFSDIVGVQHKDMGRIKIALEEELRIFLTPGRLVPYNMDTFQKLMGERNAREKTIFQPADMQFFFRETKLTNDGLCVKVRLKDNRPGSKNVSRTYYAIFSLERDGKGGFPIKVYTVEQYKAAGEFANGTPKIKAEDAKAIERYVQYEKIIDPWLATKMKAGQYTACKTDEGTSYGNAMFYYSHAVKGLLIKELRDEITRALREAYGMKMVNEDDIFRSFLDRKLVFILAGDGEVPEIEDSTADGRVDKIKVFAHSSNEATYIVLDDKQWRGLFDYAASVDHYGFSATKAMGGTDEYTYGQVRSSSHFFFHRFITTGVHETGVLGGLAYDIEKADDRGAQSYGESRPVNILDRLVLLNYPNISHLVLTRDRIHEREDVAMAGRKPYAPALQSPYIPDQEAISAVQNMKPVNLDENVKGRDYAAGGTEKPVKLSDIAGIQHKDIGNIELWFLAFLKRVNYNEDDVTVKNMQRYYDGNKNLLGRTIFQLPGAQLSIYEAGTERGVIRVEFLLIDDNNGPRMYYVEYAPAGREVKVYKARRYNKAITGFTKGTPGMKVEDAKAIERYVQHEKIIDPWIAKHMRNPDNFIEITDYIVYNFLSIIYGADKHPYKDLNSIFSNGIRRLLTALIFKRRIVIIKVKKGEERPVISEVGQDGKEYKIEVGSHSSQNALYIFLDEESSGESKGLPMFKSFKELLLHTGKGDVRAMRAVAKKYILPKLFHEMGVALGLDYRVTKDGGIINDMDRLYEMAYISRKSKEGMERTALVKRLKEKLSLGGFLTDLDYIKGRDYAAGENNTKLTFQDLQLALKEVEAQISEWKWKDVAKEDEIKHEDGVGYFDGVEGSMLHSPGGQIVYFSGTGVDHGDSVVITYNRSAHETYNKLRGREASLRGQVARITHATFALQLELEGIRTQLGEWHCNDVVAGDQIKHADGIGYFDGVEGSMLYSPNDQRVYFSGTAIDSGTPVTITYIKSAHETYNKLRGLEASLLAQIKEIEDYLIGKTPSTEPGKSPEELLALIAIYAKEGDTLTAPLLFKIYKEHYEELHFEAPAENGLRTIERDLYEAKDSLLSRGVITELDDKGPGSTRRFVFANEAQYIAAKLKAAASAGMIDTTSALCDKLIKIAGKDTAPIIGESIKAAASAGMIDTTSALCDKLIKIAGKDTAPIIGESIKAAVSADMTNTASALCDKLIEVAGKDDIAIMAKCAQALYASDMNNNGKKLALAIVKLNMPSSRAPQRDMKGRFVDEKGKNPTDILNLIRRYFEELPDGVISAPAVLKLYQAHYKDMGFEAPAEERASALRTVERDLFEASDSLEKQGILVRSTIKGVGGEFLFTLVIDEKEGAKSASATSSSLGQVEYKDVKVEIQSGGQPATITLNTISPSALFQTPSTDDAFIRVVDFPKSGQIKKHEYWIRPYESEDVIRWGIDISGNTTGSMGLKGSKLLPEVARIRDFVCKESTRQWLQISLWSNSKVIVLPNGQAYYLTGQDGINISMPLDLKHHEPLAQITEYIDRYLAVAPAIEQQEIATMLPLASETGLQIPTFINERYTLLVDNSMHKNAEEREKTSPGILQRMAGISLQETDLIWSQLIHPV